MRASSRRRGGEKLARKAAELFTGGQPAMIGPTRQLAAAHGQEAPPQPLTP